VKTTCESDEPHPYPVRSFTYRMEQARADEVQRVIMYIVYTDMVCITWISVSSLVGIYNHFPEDETLDSKPLEGIKN
jgi:hypothetical protein